MINCFIIFTITLLSSFYSTGVDANIFPNDTCFNVNALSQDEDEECKIVFPTAFVPSRLGPNRNVPNYELIDYKNEIFHPVSKGVQEYRFLVFNRWGMKVFESDNILFGWDGYFNGKLCAQDVYVWRAVGKFTNGKKFDMRGNVTMLW
jgi:hypothetical protein